MSDERYTAVVDRLRSNGYRLTPQRLAVIRLLLQDESHPSVEQLYQRVRVDFPTTSRATVYNTIDTLKQIGEVCELEFSDGSNRYDGQRPEDHPHLICSGCARIEDLPLDGLAPRITALARTVGYLMHGHRLDVYGLCPGCQLAAAEMSPAS